MQRCVGPLVTSLLRSLSALWTRNMQDMILLWTCECPETEFTQHARWTSEHHIYKVNFVQAITTVISVVAEQG